MASASIESIVDQIVEAYRSGTQVAVPSQADGEFSVDDAFAVQDAVARRRAGDGSTRIRGFKAGLATPPFMGRALAHDIVLDRGNIPFSDLSQPLVEPEVAFVLGDRLAGTDLTIADVFRATDFVLPAFEIIDKRTTSEGRAKTSDIIADNGWFGRMVLGGSPVSATDIDLADIPVDLYADGKIVERGRSNNASANPAHAVIIIAGLLDSIGLALEPGQVVLTGSCTTPFEPSQGSVVRAVFRGLGDVEVSFT
ncbi:MAG: fumarylacetoacetate hydrolase family protein [Dehalococcoidia bacterium]